MAVYIGAMNMRGKRAEKPKDDILGLNVTSAQATKSLERVDFSPMSEVKDGYKGFYCFENYWQAGKVMEGIDHKKSVAWWKMQKKGRRKYPKGTKVLYSNYDGIIRDYIASRKEIYVPEYFNLVKNRKAMEKWKKIVKEGNDVMIFDYDGPRDDKGEPICLKVTKQMLKKKINDTKHPFGHGYVIAGYLAGYEPKDYV